MTVVCQFLYLAVSVAPFHQKTADAIAESVGTFIVFQFHDAHVLNLKSAVFFCAAQVHFIFGDFHGFDILRQEKRQRRSGNSWNLNEFPFQGPTE
ncbi:hypothetical protein CEXT_480391 [Caerostris extrusa]|uniref:Secreted protein n=1 Tax=Caerostris extrusa TaxID=172846 RepID=A0AAV4XHV1_CAEEX|nr:hypothetical protein CEXT_480391 [Caerostris extrusa]